MALGKNLKKKSIAGKPETGSIESSDTSKNEDPESSIEEKVVSEPALDNKSDGDNKRTRFKMSRKELRETETEKVNEFTIVVFPVGNEEYALKIDQIKEIVDLPPIAKIPQTSSHTLGLTNIRGEIYGVWDLSILFRLSEPGDTGVVEGKYTIVIQIEDYYIALVSKEMPRTLSVGESSVEEASHILKHANRHDEYIRGVIRKEGRLIILIDILDVIKSTYDLQKT